MDIELNVETLERSQRYAGRAFSGQLRTNPVEAIFAEANLHSIETRAIQLSTIAMENLQMTTATNPRHTIATQPVRQRIQNPSWREKAGDVLGKIVGVLPEIST